MSRTIYVKSGNVGNTFFVWPLIFLPSAVLLSAVYSYASVYIPLGGFVTLFLLLGYTFGLIVACGLGFQAAKCRNETLAKLLGFAGGLFALWAAWIFFLFALIRRETADITLMQLVEQPLAVMEIILDINTEGWFSIGSFTPKGFLLWVFWALEALVIVGGLVLVGDSATAREMFCERCDRWVPVADKMTRQLPPGVNLEKFTEADPRTFLDQPLAEDVSLPVVVHEYLTCPGCHLTRGHRFQLSTPKLQDDGQIKANTTDHPQLLVENA